MTKCPQCGHEWGSKPGYHGALREYVPLIESSYKDGKSPKEIALFLTQQGAAEVWSAHSYMPRYSITASMVCYVLRRLGYGIPTQPKPNIGYPERNKAIVVARNEGATLKEIGHRFNISKDRVRQILFKYTSRG